ncbi:hypothetical protein [Allochromatium vinosum]|uniref:hypothetical protein n=1 Tax=Allochromatium vinosum TaxID=1049 RepID=UPI0019053ABC|nr:hypothetical protein [Allochromatium vinosum]MBK1654925.1 hypothetical protein [Allochromatium vinosum]
MSEPSDLVIAYLERLYRHRALIAAAYHQGEIEADDETVQPRGLKELRRQRTLIPLGEDRFRLASSLTRHLNEVLQKEQLFAAVGGQIADLATRLPWLVDDALKAGLEGRTEDLDLYLDAFRDAVFELADQIEQSLQTLRTLTDTHFAGVRTLAEKQRQNTWYIQRAERIGEALKALQTGELMERLDEEPVVAELAVVFRRQIRERVPEWRASLLDITDILKNYLYRLRRIEPAGRRLRAFQLFLRRHPDYVMPDIDEWPELPEWAKRAAPLQLLAHPDLQDGATAEALSEVVVTLPVASNPIQRPPRIGALIAEDTPASTILTIAPRLDQVALRRFIAALPPDGQSVSALAWKRAQRDLLRLDDALWLHGLLHEATLGRRRNARLRFEPLIGAVSHPLSGNIVVHDVQVSRVQTPSGGKT